MIKLTLRAYGAVGDGVTNDTAAFNAALKSLAERGGRSVSGSKRDIPHFCFGITRARLAAVSSGVRLIGEGRRDSVLRVNGDADEYFAAM